ncbi:hypothetical protein MMC11_004874 [Xylographa trunciseda]|nr:hypothetical protein [Xylographa trunciseda]
MSQDPQSHGMVIALSVIFTVLALSFVALRVYARRIKGAHFATDDYLILASAGFFVICITVLTIILAANSHLGDHMVLTPSGMPTPPTYAFNLVLRIFQTVHVIPIMFAKLCLFFYRRIFRGAAISAVTITTVILVISFCFSTLFDCTPINLSLTIPPGSPGVYCIDQTANFWGLSISDVLVDLIILVIPFPFPWKLQMSTKQKFGVSSMFLLAALTIAASIARLVCFINAGKLLAKNDPDLTYYVAPTAYWVVIECSLAITSACLAILRPVFHGWSLESVLRSLTSRLTLNSTRSANRSGFSKHSARPYRVSAGDENSTTSLQRQQQQQQGFRAVVTGGPPSPPGRLGTELAVSRPEGIMVQKEWGRQDEAV